jgi:hypothetical protein
MLRQTSDQVARAGGGYLPSFRPVVVAALLACLDHAGHPLRAALRRRPDLCDRLDRATGLRNQGSHQQDREPTADEAGRRARPDVLDRFAPPPPPHDQQRRSLMASRNNKSPQGSNQTENLKREIKKAGRDAVRIAGEGGRLWPIRHRRYQTMCL